MRWRVIPRGRNTRADEELLPIAAAATGRRAAAAGWQIGLLLAVMIPVGLWALTNTPWYHERRWQHQPLAALQRESGAHKDDPLFLYYLGLRLNEAQRYNDAVPVLERAAGLDPDGAKQREEWAQALLGVGQVTSAFIELRQFVGTHPHSGPGHLALGKFYMTQRSLVRAEEEFAAAARLSPDDGETWSYLAVARSDLENPVGALAAAQRAVGLRPNNVNDRLLLASVYGRLNRNVEARTAYELACRLGPDRAETHREHALWLLDHPMRPQDLELAETEARRSIALNNGDAKAYLVLGRILIRERRDAAAIAPLERSTAINPINPAPLLALEQACNRLRRTEEAHRWSLIYLRCQQQNTLNMRLQDALSQNPNDPTPHRQLARLMADWGDVVECVKHEAAALRCPRDTSPALVAAGRDFLAVDRPEDALPLANRALTIMPADPTAHELRGDALLKLQQPRMAAAEYDAVVRVWPDREPQYRSKLAAYFALRRKTGR
jgi:tetratricopeptide (TPR) repeat protein